MTIIIVLTLFLDVQIGAMFIHIHLYLDICENNTQGFIYLIFFFLKYLL